MIHLKLSLKHKCKLSAFLNLPCVTSVPRYIINSTFRDVIRYGKIFIAINTNFTVFNSNILNKFFNDFVSCVFFYIFECIASLIRNFHDTTMSSVIIIFVVGSYLERNTKLQHCYNMILIQKKRECKDFLSISLHLFVC